MQAYPIRACRPRLTGITHVILSTLPHKRGGILDEIPPVPGDFIRSEAKDLSSEVAGFFTEFALSKVERVQNDIAQYAADVNASRPSTLYPESPAA